MCPRSAVWIPASAHMPSWRSTAEPETAASYIFVLVDAAITSKSHKTRMHSHPARGLPPSHSSQGRRPEVFTEDTKGDIGTASGKTEASEIEVYASQVDGMTAAMNLELHQPPSTVLKTILKDWPRTWLDGEG